MSKLLHLDSSGRGSISVTQSLTAYFAKGWKEANSNGEVIYRNLSESDLQFLSPELVSAIYTPENQQSHEQKNLLRQSNSLLSELFAADTYVFGVPMYNFGVPAVFKAYIDLVVLCGKSFVYENGRPAGLLDNKRLVVITASGGDYSYEPMKSCDFVEPYIRTIMSFVGVRDITFIKVHGNYPEMVAATAEQARRSIDKLIGPVLAKS